MQTNQLAAIFKKRYHAAGSGMVVTTIHLLGIKFAEHLKGQPLKHICALADVAESYAMKISKGVRLSQYVAIKL